MRLSVTKKATVTLVKLRTILSSVNDEQQCTFFSKLRTKYYLYDADYSGESNADSVRRYACTKTYRGTPWTISTR